MGRAGLQVGTNFVVARSHYDGVPIDGDRDAELIPNGPVAGGGLLLQTPGSATARIHIGRASTRIRADCVTRCPDHNRLTTDSDRVAIAVEGRPLAGSQLLLL